MHRAYFRRSNRKKIVSVWAWYSGEDSGPEKCKVCKNFQVQSGKSIDCNDYKGSGIPCSNLPPERGQAEEEFLEVWAYANTQWRVGGMGAVGLDYPAIFRVAEMLDCEVDEIFLRRLKAIERAELNNLQSE